MSEQPPIVPPPDPDRVAAAASPPSLQLQYATPKPRGRFQPGPDAPLLRVLRQVVFAAGLALLMYGVTSAIAGINGRDGPYFAGWGAALIGLATPLWRVRKDEE